MNCLNWLNQLKSGYLIFKIPSKSQKYFLCILYFYKDFNLKLNWSYDYISGIYYLLINMLLIISFLLLAIANSKLAYVATVFRHGARYPLTDIYDGKATAEFHGKLTPVGMRQQFLLGGYLKAEYIDKYKLINATLFPKEVEVFADTSS